LNRLTAAFSTVLPLPRAVTTIGHTYISPKPELVALNEGQGMIAIALSSNEVIEKIARYKRVMIGSDGIPMGKGAMTHPRTNAEFVQFYQQYVREKPLFTMEEAVHKMTGMAAGFFNLKGKGFIKKGFDADLVLFNRNNIGSDASAAQPWLAPRGIDSLRRVHTLGAEPRVWTLSQIPYENNIPRPLAAGLLILYL
jgi:N-acyl-D-aspartate/D-glutamate deacylase